MIATTTEATLTGDLEAAFYGLYHRESALVLRYLYAAVRDTATAEDLCGDIFCRAWDSWAGFQGDEAAARGWVMRIAHNRLVDHLRRNRRVAFEALPAEVVDTAQAPAAVAERIDLRRALAGLSTDERDLLAMRIAGLSHAEIAAAQGRSEAAVKKSWQRALLKARTLLEADA
jgi:RNA polymerase sigma-70 factor (ECF subfamily)